MIRVMFVDDEPNVLAGLRRMLRPMRSEWEMHFMDSGEAAVEALSAAGFDVVVSDMRMPGVDGLEVLKEVKRRDPHAVRIALSGHSDVRALLDSVPVAHQYLSKPCEPGVLKSAIERTCALRDLLANPALEQIVSDLDALPSLPALYQEVLDELASPNASLARVGEIIGKDVAMAARIIQVVNSAFFGLQRQISSPAQAATLLGIDVVRGLVLGVQVFSAFDVAGDTGLDVEGLWRRSVRIGGLAKSIAMKTTQDAMLADQAFMAGMMHDVGALVLASQLPEEYGRIRALASERGVEAWIAERESLGASHAEVGSYLLGLWGLPTPIIEAVANHHHPAACPHAEFSPLTAIHAADALLAEDCDDPAEEVPARLDRSYVDRLELWDHVPLWTQLAQDFCATEVMSQ